MKRLTPLVLPPRRGTGMFIMAVCAGFGLFAVSIGLSSGFWVWAPNQDGLIRAALIAIIAPAIGEELVFRGPLLLITKSEWKMALLSLGLFVLWHPFNALYILPEARETFFNPAFLIIAAGLGMACNWLTLRTQSLWPTIGLHWVLVVAWKGLFGAPSFF